MKKIRLSRKSQARNRLDRNLLSSLFLYEKIRTTSAKSRLLKNHGQSLISRVSSSSDSLGLRRFLEANLYGGAVARVLDTKGQYTGIRTIKMGYRYGDGAEQSFVALIKKEGDEIKKLKKGQKKVVDDEV